MIQPFSQSGRRECADWRRLRRLPDGDVWSSENSADWCNSLRDRLDPHRHVDQYTDVAGWSFVNRTSDRPGDLTSNRLHHRGSQAGTARLLDLLWTDAGIIWHGAMLSEGRLPTMANSRMAHSHLCGRAHRPGAVLRARVARLAHLEGPS